ncbi:HipA N-terminal domain-containing protein [Parapedobacter sp. DT-150]|uniref:HipA N-terminal domain-containing protein n=1 Tax=Parapedobacter sp. DT-150 TaxID=3396162 RepID=UPI003F1D11D2
MRKAAIYYKEQKAGVLTETDNGEYVFEYDQRYLKTFPEWFITFTMPVTDKPYVANRLFPFFEGLIPEGWLLDIAAENWKINRNDRMGLLMACCRNCIGAVSVVPIAETDGK